MTARSMNALDPEDVRRQLSAAAGLPVTFAFRAGNGAVVEGSADALTILAARAGFRYPPRGDWPGAGRLFLSAARLQLALSGTGLSSPAASATSHRSFEGAA